MNAGEKATHSFLFLTKMIGRRHSPKPFILRDTLIRLSLCFVPCLAAAFQAAAPDPGMISPPKVYIHCLKDNRKMAFVLRWDYHFAYALKNVSGFRVYRRIEGGDYSLLAAFGRDGTEVNLTVNQEFGNKYVYSYRDNTVEPGKAYWYKVTAFDPAGNQAFNEVHIRTDPAADPVAGPDNVLVVINRRSRESVEIGEYYGQRRRIPKQNLLYLSYQGNPDFVRVGNFEKEIESPIREYLEPRRLKEKILYIVMTYGFPCKIPLGGGKAVDSVDARLTNLFDEYRNDPNFEIGVAGGTYRNPYFLAGSHFSRANGNRGYLVTRLDGPLANPTDAHYNRQTAHPDDKLQYLKNMIDNAIWAEQDPGRLSGKGYFDRRFEAAWAFPYGQGDIFINGAYDCSVRFGFRSFLDTTPRLFGTAPTDSGGDDPLFCDSALWYAGWYSHFYQDVFDWAKGAVGFHIESWTAQNIRKELKRGEWSGWLWVPGMIRAGVTATMGPVHEPGLTGVPRIDWFFRYLFHGFSFAEAAYMANYVAAGQMVMIGDPLYNPFRANRLERTPPTITITSPEPGQKVRGTKILIEGTLDDAGISMLDNGRPVRKGRFSYTQPIGTSGTNEARLPVLVSATDTSGNTSSTTVTVHWVNNPPRLQPIQPMETSEGKTLAFKLKASDPDNDRLTYYFVIGTTPPRGASLNRRTGQFKWSPDFDQAGSYDIAFRVADGYASDVQHATVTVRQAGSHPPKFGSIPKKMLGTPRRMVYFELKADDRDGDTLTFSATAALPQGGRIVQSPPNRAVFLWEPTPQQVGSHTIVFTVEDGKGGRDTVPVELQITPQAPPGGPVIVPDDNRSLRPG